MARDDSGEDPDLAHLRAQVNQAHADVRRAESVEPALKLSLLVTCVPLLSIMLVVVIRFAS